MWVKVQLFNCRSKEKELRLGKKKRLCNGAIFKWVSVLLFGDSYFFPWSHACDKANRQLFSYTDNFCFPYSCFGAISSLNGEPEKGVAVEVRA